VTKLNLSRNTLAQLAHVGWGALIVVCFAYADHVFLGLIVEVAFAFIKEAVFDPLTEDKTTQGNGYEDFAFWLVGGIVGFVYTQLVAGGW
jgi:hypothetical protein